MTTAQSIAEQLDGMLTTYFDEIIEGESNNRYYFHETKSFREIYTFADGSVFTHKRGAYRTYNDASEIKINN